MSIASREEILAWLGHPVTKAVGAELEARLQRYRVALPDYVVKGDTDKARSASGAIKAYEEFISEFFAHPPEEPEAQTEEKYRDPAERPSTKET